MSAAVNDPGGQSLKTMRRQDAFAGFAEGRFCYRLSAPGFWLLPSMMKAGLANDWTHTHLRVRYAETDQMGVVYYANYFIWFEVGRTDLCRQRGFAYRDMEKEDGLCIIVAEARCRYKAPAKYDDEIEVRTRVTHVRRRVITFAYEIYRKPDDELLAAGETVHVITDLSGRPRALPDKYRALLLAGSETESGSQGSIRQLSEGSQ